jgi:5-formyltetrahydrofolate cyclo-ligase
MEEVHAVKDEIRKEIAKTLGGISEKKRGEKVQSIESRLFEFANFLEARIALLYVAGANEIPTENILRRAYAYQKVVVLPQFDRERGTVTLCKVDSLEKDLVPGARGVLEPNPARCKPVPIQRIDIAIIPGLAFDEKGSRIGTGQGFYDRFIPELPATTRKVALAFEEQVIPQAPTEPHDKHVDIIITDRRIIYKI